MSEEHVGEKMRGKAEEDDNLRVESKEKFEGLGVCGRVELLLYLTGYSSKYGEVLFLKSF